MAKKWLSKIDHILKNNREYRANNGLGSAITMIIVGIAKLIMWLGKPLLRIPFIKKLTTAAQKQFQTAINEVNRQKLQVELDAAGDNEPIENYFIEETAEIDEQTTGYKSRFIVTTTASRLSVQSPDHPVQTIIWSKVTKINIWVEDPDPIDSEAWIVIRTDDEVASFPEWVTGSDKAKKRMLTLNGFNHDLYKKALNHEGEATFTVYEKTN